MMISNKLITDTYDFTYTMKKSKNGKDNLLFELNITKGSKAGSTNGKRLIYYITHHASFCGLFSMRPGDNLTQKKYMES